jgi:hypothetical protein
MKGYPKGKNRQKKVKNAEKSPIYKVCAILHRP